MVTTWTYSNTLNSIYPNISVGEQKHLSLIGACTEEEQGFLIIR